MARHIPTSQVLDHVKTATSISVDGQVFNNITVDNEFLTVGTIKFPLDLFDIGGMNTTTMVLMDSDKNYRTLMLLGPDGFNIDHPDWETEEYLASKLRNNNLISK